MARNDPFSAFNFLVRIGAGAVTAGFMEVGGLDLEIAVIEYREGGDKTHTVHKLPGLAKYSDIVLKRGLTKDTTLWDWIKTVVGGKVQRRNVTITLLDDQRLPVVSWLVREAWPNKWEGPNLNAKGDEVAIETLVLAHEGFDRV